MTAPLSLSREEFRDLAAGDRPAVIRVETTLSADVTPLSAFATLTGRADGDRTDYSFLLESAEKTASSDPDGAFRPSTEAADRHARYSFVGYDPDAVVTVAPDGTEIERLTDRAPVDRMRRAVADCDGDAVDELRAAMPDARRENFAGNGRQALDGGLVGLVGYDAVYDLHLDEVGVDRPDSRFPDAQFVLTTRTLVFDEHAESPALVFTPILDPDDDPDAVYDDLVAEARRVSEALAAADAPATGGIDRSTERARPREDYEGSVRAAKEHVNDGDVYQAVISRKRELYGDVDSLALYGALREINPSPYMYLLGFDDLDVVGASPETLVSVRGEEVMANPIAGTCPRGESPVEDRRLAGEMLADGKERAEHTMLVDLARNDVRRVSEPGSVRVEEFMNVLKYSHVQHIESTVTGSLAGDYDDVEDPAADGEGAPDAFDAVRAAHPAGTLSGAPKVRAMEIIDDLEPEPRGPYGGGVGYVSWDGDADTAIVIRTATVERDPETVPDGAAPDDDRLTVRAGAGIVADSDPGREYEETESKMDGVLDAVEAVRTGSDADGPDNGGDAAGPESGGDGDGPESGNDGGERPESGDGGDEPESDDDRAAEPEVSR